MNETSALIELGELIRTGNARRIRTTAGIPVEALAADLGVSGATVRRWEAGDVQPGRRNAFAWLRLLRQIQATASKEDAR
jgi:DNA-binding transcriptional regulator YiaG